MAVAIGDSNILTATTGLAAPAGSNRMAYVAAFSDHATNGAKAATAMTLGGQSMTLIDTAQAASPFREGCSVAVFRMNESAIGSMSGNALGVTWDVTPDNPIHAVIYFTGVDQSTPNGTVVSNSHDVSQATWDPGDVNGVADGFICAFSGLSGGSTHVFDNLTETQALNNAGAHQVLGTVATTDTSAIDVAVTYGSVQRPGVFSGFVVNPGASNTTIVIPTGPWR